MRRHQGGNVRFHRFDLFLGVRVELHNTRTATSPPTCASPSLTAGATLKPTLSRGSFKGFAGEGMTEGRTVAGAGGGVEEPASGSESKTPVIHKVPAIEPKAASAARAATAGRLAIRRGRELSEASGESLSSERPDCSDADLASPSDADAAFSSEAELVASSSDADFVSSSGICLASTFR